MVDYNLDIPDGPNNPSNDQPLMKENTNAINTILDVDHISFNTNNGGQHKQVTFNNKNAAGAQTDPQSTLYTGSGTASAVSQLLYRNQNRIFQISAIRAWAFCNTGGIVSSQSFNVDTVVRNSAGNYTITLTSGAVSSSNFAVIYSYDNPANLNPILVSYYTITGSGTFTLTFRSATLVPNDPTNFSFQVLQI